MAAKQGAGDKEWIGPVDVQFAIPVALRRVGNLDLEGKYAGHFVSGALPKQRAREQHEAAALGINRHALFSRRVNRSQEGTIGRQRRGVSFRKTTADIEGA